MSREDYIKFLISERNMTIKGFALSIGMPYSTLLSMLNGSMGGAAIDNVMKICKGLNITINELQSCGKDENNTNEVRLTLHEKTLIIAYRKNTAMQPAIDKILGINENEDHTPYIAAYDGSAPDNIHLSLKNIKELDDEN